MQDQGGAAAKICRACGADCSNRERVRDKQGRYVCKACLDRAKAKKQRQAAATGAGPGGGAAVAAATAQEADGADAAGANDWLFDDVPQNEPCPSCQAPVRADQQVCMRCGHNKITGKQLRSRVIEAPKEPSALGQGAKAAASTGATLAAPLAWVLGGSIGGAIGAGIWAGVTYQTNYEVGWIAWGVGALTGFGTAAAAQGRTGVMSGVVAAIIAIGALLGGKYATVSLIVDDRIAELRETSPSEVTEADALWWLADDIVSEKEAQGETVEWPEGVTFETAVWPQDYPPQIVVETRRRWSQMSSAERDAYRRAIVERAAAGTEAAGDAIKEVGFVSSFSMYDFLFFGLAIVTAAGVGSGGSIE